MSKANRPKKISFYAVMLRNSSNVYRRADILAEFPNEQLAQGRANKKNKDAEPDQTYIVRSVTRLQ